MRKKRIFAEFKTPRIKRAVDIWCGIKLFHGNETYMDWKYFIRNRDLKNMRRPNQLRGPLTVTEEMNDEREQYIQNMIQKKKEIERNYGHISEWNVSNIDNMERLFAGKHNFDEDISRWDVSRVRNMKSMFFECINFNKPLNTWDVSMLKPWKVCFMVVNNLINL